MADFRKLVFALAVAALFIGTASAQPAFTCTSNAGVPPLVRSQGLTELVGDVILNCTGGTPTASGVAVPQNNVQVFLNTNVTSRLIPGNTGLTNASEALLMIDEPGPTVQRYCTAVNCPLTGANTLGAAGTGINYAAAAPATTANVYQGAQAAANSISWLGVPIDPPGSTGVRIIRITNIRANANQLGVSSTLIPTQIVMFISVTGNSQVAINNPQQTVAYIQNGLTFSVFTGTSTTAGSVSLQQCNSNNSALSTDNTSTTYAQGRTITLSFKENFASAFKTRVNWGLVTTTQPGTSMNGGTITSQNVPGQLYNNESGFYRTDWPANLSGAGLADSATKLIARFNNVPAGVVLYVSINQVNATTKQLGNDIPTAKLVSTDANGAGGALPGSVVAKTTTVAGDGDIAPVTLVNGSGVAVWEVVNVDPLAIDELRFAVGVAYTANPAANLPGLGASTVNGTFAPLSTVGIASTGPVVRFADTSTAAATFTITACTTNILFPFLTNQAGFDSGVSIANTSADPFGTATQAGPCTLNYYGNTTGGGAAPAAQKSGVVNAGTLLLFTLSGGGNLGIAATPGFQGYMIASCSFQYAHGFAFISDVGANKVSEAYLGLILDAAFAGNRTGNTSETRTH